MHQRAAFSPMAILGLLVVLLSTLAACKTEEQIVPADLSAWPTVHLGFHQFRTPPDFTAPDITATIGSTAITVLRNQAGRAQDIVLAQEDVGEIIRHMTVNDWEVFVTSEDMGLIVSSYTYLVLGLYRVGNDVVMTRDSMSRTDFPKGDDAEKWLFHSLTRVAPVGPNARAMGFVFDGLFFETAYFDQAGPDAEAMFSASAVRARKPARPRRMPPPRTTISCTSSSGPPIRAVTTGLWSSRTILRMCRGSRSRTAH